MEKSENLGKEGDVVEVYARPTRKGNFLCQYDGKYFYLSAHNEFLGYTNVGEWNWATVTWKRKAEHRKVILPSQIQ